MAFYSEKRRYKIALASSLLLSSTLVFGFYCPPQFQEMWVAPMFQSATLAITEAITSVDVALSAQLQLNSERLTSAIAVLTKQKALAANQIADGHRTAGQATAEALNAMSQMERVKQARFEFGGEFGQGFSPCKVYATRVTMTARDADMAAERRVRVMSEIQAAPGRYADPLTVRSAMVQTHRASFCTQDQVDSGLCKNVGKMPGADLSVSTLFEPAMEGEALYDAKVAFVNNMVGLPDAPVPQTAANSAASAAYSLAKTRKDALISPALASFKEIQLDYSGVNTAHGGMDLPLALHFRNEVKRYAGKSSEYDAWTRVMSAQNERGLLVEMLKVKALDLAVQEKQYRQYERMEAHLAALISMEINGSAVADKATASAQQAARQRVTGAIR